MISTILFISLTPIKTSGQGISSQARSHEVDLNSCVSFVRHTSFWGWSFERVEKALDIPVLSDVPVLGSIALFRYEPLGHAALVASIATSTYDVIEANYKEGQITRRTLPLKGDKNLRGFYWK